MSSNYISNVLHAYWSVRQTMQIFEGFHIGEVNKTSGWLSCRRNNSESMPWCEVILLTLTRVYDEILKKIELEKSTSIYGNWRIKQNWIFNFLPENNFFLRQIGIFSLHSFTCWVDNVARSWQRLLAKAKGFLKLVTDFMGLQAWEHLHEHLKIYLFIKSISFLFCQPV